VDVLHFTPNWKIVRKLMYESLKRRGDFCWHCHCGIYSYPMWTAIRHEIPLVFWGEWGEFSTYRNAEELVDRGVEFFNLKVNLGINAEDMLGMLDGSVSDYEVTERDMKPYTYPPLRLLREKKVRSVPLGYFIPWDTKKHVNILKRELGWRGSDVENVPPEYDYDKVECFFTGVRDYIKFLKRGFGRTTHLASVDIRNSRLTRHQGERLVAKYDGRRPESLDLFLAFLDITEDEFMELVKSHVVAPHEMPSLDEMRKKRSNRLEDMDSWLRITGDLEKDRKLSESLRGRAGEDVTQRGLKRIV
jgi:hypothetical protein